MNKINIIKYLIFLFFILIIFFCSIYKINEYYDYDSISLHSWWNDSDNASKGLIYKIIDIPELKDKYKHVKIYSVMGDPPEKKDSDTLYIQYSGESRYHDPKLFDINFIPKKDSIKQNIIGYPLGFYEILNNTMDKNIFLKKRDYKKKENFCIFSVTNGSSEPRNNFFKELSKYKKVDSCGEYLNNMGFNCPNGKEYFNFLNNYKFMICFENSSVENYFTEKLINAFYAGTIPIYWGCPNISDYVNMKSILYLKPNYTDKDVKNLIEKIKLLDENDELYMKMYNEIFFKNGILPDKANFDKLKEKVKNLSF
jgi:hypothetical protein